MSEIGIVREYGNSTMASADITLDSPVVKDLLDKDMGKLQKLLDYLKTVEYVEPFHHIEGPIVDKLQRNKHFGWYGRVAAPGLDAFAEHFRCHEEHLPSEITFKFMWRLTKRWWLEHHQPEEENRWT